LAACLHDEHITSQKPQWGARLLNKQEEEKGEWLVGRVEAEESRDD
jgi:hypothetical protein